MRLHQLINIINVISIEELFNPFSLIKILYFIDFFINYLFQNDSNYIKRSKLWLF